MNTGMASMMMINTNAACLLVSLWLAVKWAWDITACSDHNVIENL